MCDSYLECFLNLYRLTAHDFKESLLEGGGAQREQAVQEVGEAGQLSPRRLHEASRRTHWNQICEVLHKLA